MEVSSSLPFEVVEEILYRTPIKDLIRFKSVCKEWYALFKDKRFIYKHLDLSQDDARFIRIHHTTFQIINPVTLDLLTLPLPSELIVGQFYNCLSCVIHCDGLLLCTFRDANKNRHKLAVWNPVFSSRIKWIQPLHAYSGDDDCGFGYDSDNYKILRFKQLDSEYQIYDFKSKLWRVFPATFDWMVYVMFQYVSMKGNMYWIAETRGSDSQMFIQSFDFSKETFKPICSSFPVKIGVDLVRHEALDIVVLSGFGGDRLSLLHQHRVGDDSPRVIKIEVWVTNKVTDAAVSWTKYFNVTHPHLPILHPHLYVNGIPTYFIHKTNGIMLCCNKLVQIEDYDYACPSFYEICEGEIKNQIETGPLYPRRRSTCICGGLYVPSLVPVPE